MTNPETEKYITWRNIAQKSARRKLRDLIIFDMLFLRLVAIICSMFTAWDCLLGIACGVTYLTITCGYFHLKYDLEWDEKAFRKRYYESLYEDS